MANAGDIHELEGLVFVECVRDGYEKRVLGRRDNHQRIVFGHPHPSPESDVVQERHSPTDRPVQMHGRSAFASHELAEQEFLRLFDVPQLHIPELAQDLPRRLDMLRSNQRVEVIARVGERRRKAHRLE